MPSVLRVRDLVTSFATGAGRLRAVDGVSFEVAEGQTLAVVGESGSGKSVTALSVLGIVPEPGRVESGEVWLRDVNLRELPESQLQHIRGRDIAMIFQDPMASLNPIYSVGAQVAEAVRIHRGVSRKAAHDRACELLGLVGIPSPRDRARAYPHQLSGGMRQRVMIAMALSCEPAVLLADEPTTALDVTIQAQILDLLQGLQDEFGMAIVFITHDLGVVADFADTALVMYAGQVVEAATVPELFSSPGHPYTRGLLSSLPKRRVSAGKHLPTIPGTVPSLLHLPPGCRFSDRCDVRAAQPAGYERCEEEEPELVARDGDDGGRVRYSRCHFGG